RGRVRQDRRGLAVQGAQAPRVARRRKAAGAAGVILARRGGEHLMSTKRFRVRTAAALVAAAPVAALAQGPATAPSRPVSIELQALNPPVPDDLVLEEARRV